MRMTLTLLLIIFTLPAFSAEEFKGCFQKSDDQIALITRYWPIYTKTQKGKEKLEELRQEGYTCKTKPNSWVLCSKFMPTDTLSILDIETRLPEVSPFICFGKLRSKTLISEAESLDVWEYKQVITASQWETSEYVLWDLHSSDLIKLKVLDTDEDAHWINYYKNKGQMQKAQSVSYRLDEGYYRILVYRNYR